jgi:predicted nucleic acid-binding protein
VPPEEFAALPKDGASQVDHYLYGHPKRLMTAVFADTFYWIAFTNVQDLAHEKVKSFTLASPPRLILATEEVLTEYLNHFAAWGPHFRGVAAANVQKMRVSRRVRIVLQTAASFTSGLALYQSRLDKGYSPTDCISMQTMRREGLTEALTNGSTSSRRGFSALFRGEDQ